MKMISEDSVSNISKEALEKFYSIRQNFEALCIFYDLPIPIVRLGHENKTTEKEVFISPSIDEQVASYILATELVSDYMITLASIKKEYRHMVGEIISEALLEHQEIDGDDIPDIQDNSQN